MNDDFTPFELAVKLKEKGFNEKCYHYYQKEVLLTDNCWNRYNRGTADRCSAPTISQVLKWLRKEKKIHIVCPFYKDEGFYYYVQRIGNAARIVSSFGDSDDCFDTYEQAALVGISYVLDKLI